MKRKEKGERTQPPFGLLGTSCDFPTFLISVGLISFLARLTFYLDVGGSSLLRILISAYKSARRNIPQNINLIITEQNLSAQILQRRSYSYVHSQGTYFQNTADKILACCLRCT
jgi:hypothetical protein